jgi:hypothetical protein
MTDIISLSGGLGSAVTALLAHETRRNVGFELVFADTLIEDPDLYRFIKDIARVVNKEIHWLRDGRTPWQVFRDVRFIGNQQKAQCSSILKTRQVKLWCAQHAAPDDDMILGMGLFESDRIERAQRIWAPRRVRSLLIENKIAPGDYASWMERYSIEPPSLYQYGFPHNNCGGFCVRAGMQAFATLLTHFPERYAAHEAEEQAVLAEIPTTRPFLEKSFNGKRRGISMKEFRELYQAGKTKVSPYDYGGCGCFTEE